MARRLKLLTGLSTLALSGVFVLSGCGGEGEGESESEGALDPTAITAEGEGESEGGTANSSEGESENEGGTIQSGDPATDDVEYLTRLGLVRGHLLSFMELYRAGNYEMALPHAKHPESELYADLIPAFEARGKIGFADELERLAMAAQERGDVEAAFEDVAAAIVQNMPALNTKVTLLAVSKIVTVAADEFALGVNEEGTIVNAHEYQDAYGFLVSARDMLAREDTADINAVEAIAVAHEQIDAALLAFDGLVVDTTDGAAATLYGAASRIEIAALGL